MSQTRFKPNQINNSTNPGSIIASDSSNIFTVVSSSPGTDHLFFYDHSALAVVPLTVGTNLSITGTTLNASAGAGGYVTIQEEGSDLTARTKLNFVGAGFTAADDAGNVRTNVTLNTFLNTLATQGNVSLSGTDVTNTLPATKGGTGQSSYTVGALLSANTTTSLTPIAAVASGSVLKSAGTNTLPVWGTLASTDLTNSSNIALLNGTQTVTGTYTFSNNITMNGTPSANTDVVTVGYVNNLLQGLDPKQSVRVATTTAGTLGTSFANGQTVDGVVLATGNRILIKDQAAPADNGIYTVNASGAPTRATDMDAWVEVPGSFVFVEEGTSNADTGWVCTANSGGTLGSTAITWVKFANAGTGVTSVAATAPAAGFTISGSPITSTGTFTFTLADDLAGLEGISTTGSAVRTGTNTWTTRTDTGTTNRITVTNGDGVAGNPTFDIAATYVGQTSITTLGTIGTGTWNGTAIGPTFGGTGLTSYTTGDLPYASATNTLAKLAIGSTGQVLKVSGGVPSWGSATPTVTRAYLTGSTASVIDLDSGTAVTDLDGANITFTVPTDLDLVFVVRNGVLLSRSGTVSRDYTLVSATGVLTLATALTAEENLMVYKFS